MAISRENCLIGLKRLTRIIYIIYIFYKLHVCIQRVQEACSFILYIYTYIYMSRPSIVILLY